MGEEILLIEGKNDDSQCLIYYQAVSEKKKKENWSVTFLVSTRIMMKNIFWGLSRGLRSLICYKKA